jgi:hypothetical protein
MGVIVIIPWEIRKQKIVLTTKYSGLEEIVMYFRVQFSIDLTQNPRNLLLFYIPCATIMLTFLAISASVVPNISS